LNEGHSAFSCLELIREQVGRGFSFADAIHWVRQRALFTTHTPVPAGHDRFEPSAVTEALSYYAHRMGTPWNEILALGRVHPEDPHETFCMTVLALKTASQVNGVSKLHGAVSREMWASLHPGTAVDDVPIGHITNGVHVETFMHPAMRDVVEERIGLDWARSLVSPAEWAERSRSVTDEDLFVVRRRLKQSLFGFLRKRFDTHAQIGPRSCAQRCAHSLEGWSEDGLTLGFARRFATYKRGDLIFHDVERALRLFQDSDRPLQLVIAGKAHPRDSPGKAVIQRVVNAVNDERFRGRVLFVEDYDLAAGRALVSGVDVWLNNPRRPREASGTSGQKVPLHGGVNLSILDGWWAEGFDGSNGFAIGDREEPADEGVQDARDLEALYSALENELLPEYYEGEAGRGTAWMRRVRRSFETLSAEYGTRRMLRDYAIHYYEPITANQR
jgi:starch phosphorylase